MVVLIEDDAAVRDAVKFSLEAEGFAVEAWESAESFLATKFPAAAACLIVDFNLGGMSGLQAVDCTGSAGSFVGSVRVVADGHTLLEVPCRVSAVVWTASLSPTPS